MVLEPRVLRVAALRASLLAAVLVPFLGLRGLLVGLVAAPVASIELWAAGRPRSPGDAGVVFAVWLLAAVGLVAVAVQEAYATETLRGAAPEQALEAVVGVLLGSAGGGTRALGVAAVRDRADTIFGLLTCALPFAAAAAFSLRGRAALAGALLALAATLSVPMAVAALAAPEGAPLAAAVIAASALGVSFGVVLIPLGVYGAAALVGLYGVADRVEAWLGWDEPEPEPPPPSA